MSSVELSVDRGVTNICVVGVLARFPTQAIPADLMF